MVGGAVKVNWGLRIDKKARKTWFRGTNTGGKGGRGKIRRERPREGTQNGAKYFREGFSQTGRWGG